MPTMLGGFLAVIGLLLAAGGLYGAVSYATEQRLSEFGVRMAIGARAGQIAALVLRQAALLCAAGVPAGMGLFLAAYQSRSRSRPRSWSRSRQSWPRSSRLRSYSPCSAPINVRLAYTYGPSCST